MLLTPEQEEMALSWVKKLGTDYVKDKVFVRNFFDDFGKALGIKGRVLPDDFDFSDIEEIVEKDRNTRINMSKEEKKKLAETRKKIRESNKEQYGYAMVDGERVEVSNYTAEPGSIFVGRGEHPLRGKWKKGAKEDDIILNLSPDSKIPEGNWKKIVWKPNFMWIAKWDDKLRERKKYVWLSDTYKIKQEREIEKFDKAKALGKEYDKIKKHIIDNLSSGDLRRRKIATVCYFIDALSMRIGDEKDKDEADTVGATTLTKDNVTIKINNRVEFDFLGKDSIRWKKEVVMPVQIIKNLKEFIADSKSVIFDGVSSENVTQFLNEIVPGLTSKVFRIYNATQKVNDYLKSVNVNKNDFEFYKKYIFTMSNLQAAIVCNHKRKLPRNWKRTLQKRKERLKILKESIKAKRNKKKEVLEFRIKKLKSKKLTEKRELKLNEYKEKIKDLKKVKMTKKEEDRVKKGELKIKMMKETRDYNLNTSLKSYIDPRVYWKWFKKVDFDWKKYYSKALQRKFSWIEDKE